ncbi:MAG: GDP-mannose 4,6-dehydratase [Nanoarchaeota archaeon]|nr:GDP-mannose 4,6-dehydratase [Nanoarchaeota archaeon]
MKILITGGAGFIGSHLADSLVNRNNEVVIIDNLSTGKLGNINQKAKLFNEDLVNHEKIKEIFEKEKPEIVYHLAANINLRKSVEDPLHDAKMNILNTLNLLEIGLKYNIKHFIFSSTGGAIYGDAKEIPTTEEYKEYPISPYGCAKLAIEKYLNFYNKIHGLKFTSLRYSNVYGPRQNPDGEAGVISIFLDNMFSGKNPIIYGGIQTRDYVYVKDVVNANILVLEDGKSEIYNLGTEKETDVIEIFSKLNKYFKNRFEPKYEEIRKGEQKRSCLSYKKIKNSLNWKPQIAIDEGLDRTYCWFLKNEDVKNSHQKTL